MKSKGKVKRRPTASPKANKESWIPGLKDVELKQLLIQRAKLNPAVAPSAKGGKGKRVTQGFIFMRPACTDFDCGWPDPDSDPPPPDDPCAGQNWVWQPDLAAQLNTGGSDCPSEADIMRIHQGLGRNLSSFRLPDPDIRVTCQAGIIYIRIWGTRVPADSCSELARRRAQIPDLTDGGNFGLFINSSLIRRMASEAFQAAPKQLDGNGVPSTSGPFHLTGLTVGFKGPNIIQTFITGYDDRPWPDVYFTKTLTDHLLTLQNCETEDSTDFSVVVQVIALLIGAIFSVAIPLLMPFVAFALFLDIDAAVNQPNGDTQGGVGSRLLKTLPNDIPLPKTGGIAPPVVMARLVRPLDDVIPRPEKKKLVIAYGQPEVDDRGLFVGGLASTQDRIPAAFLSGPSSLLIYSNANAVFSTYSAGGQDFFDTLTYRWTGGQNVIIESPNSLRTKITFRRGNAAAGTSVERTISVRVTDPEGSQATVSRTVVINVNEPNSMPPICQVKPWLPQCQP